MSHSRIAANRHQSVEPRLLQTIPIPATVPSIPMAWVRKPARPAVDLLILKTDVSP